MTSDSLAQRACVGSFVFYIVGLLIFAVGYAAPYWQYDDSLGESRSGLWKRCYKQESSSEWSCERIQTGDTPGRCPLQCKAYYGKVTLNKVKIAFRIKGAMHFAFKNIKIVTYTLNSRSHTFKIHAACRKTKRNTRTKSRCTFNFEALSLPPVGRCCSCREISANKNHWAKGLDYMDV